MTFPLLAIIYYRVVLGSCGLLLQISELLHLIGFTPQKHGVPLSMRFLKINIMNGAFQLMSLEINSHIVKLMQNVESCKKETFHLNCQIQSCCLSFGYRQLLVFNYYSSYNRFL